MSVDILPASLPLDASVHFSGVFLPYLERLVGQYMGERKGEDDGMHEALERATIVEGGRLKEKHHWLQSAVDTFYEGERQKKGVFAPSAGVGGAAPREEGRREMESGVLRKKRVLMLGSGMVAGPAVDEIAKRGDVQLFIGLSTSSKCTHILTSSPQLATRWRRWSHL